MQDLQEESDYMSDDFLASGNDLRPGLVNSRIRKRQFDMISKKEVADTQQRKIASKNHAMDQLQKGLEQPLGPDNKGYAMLQKMGFLPGSSLGSSQSGLTEPISINVKCDRKGLGRDKAIIDLRLRKKAIREKVVNTSTNVDDFRAVLSQKYRERDILSDLRKSQKSCYKFDTDSGVQPEEHWFWPEEFHPNGNSDEENGEEEISAADSFTIHEKLEMLTLYIRGSYNYCIWCGIQYDDEKDLSSSCPGPSRQDH